MSVKIDSHAPGRMTMLTAFGREVRKLRIDRGQLLKDLADGLGVSSAWLSAVETGRKSIPATLPSQIAAHYGLSERDRERLVEAAALSRKEFTVVPRQGDDLSRSVAARLARSFEDLSPAELEQIHEVLRRRDR